MRLYHTGDEGQVTSIFFRSEGQMVIDRTHCSRYEEVTRDVRFAPLALGEEELLRLRLFVDRSVIELYANGHLCLTSRVYPQGMGGYQPRLFAEGGTVRLRRVEGWTLDTIW
ncbi:MAG: GH32 C-terminal domain-containing protein [Armatimonadota bacterium]